MKYLTPALLVLFASGCWFGNSFSNDCDPAACAGTCQDNICVVGSTDTNNANNDMGVDEGEDDMPIDKIACVAHSDCGQTPELSGDQ